MAGIINKTDSRHPEHPVYKAREKARADEEARIAKLAEAAKVPAAAPSAPSASDKGTSEPKK